MHEFGDLFVLFLRPKRQVHFGERHSLWKRLCVPLVRIVCSFVKSVIFTASVANPDMFSQQRPGFMDGVFPRFP